MLLPNALVDRFIRWRVRFHETPLDRYQIRIARSAAEYDQALRLVHASYVYQGLESVRANEVRLTPQHLLPQATVILAYEGEQLVGTMTVTADSPAGLPLDKDYPEEMAQLRKSGARIVEYGSLTVVQRCWHSGVTNLMNIAAYRIATEQHHATHTVVGVAPRAMPVYRALFNFRVFGGQKHHVQLVSAMYGLVQDMAAAPAFVRRHFSRPMRSGHLPIAHFSGLPLPCIDLPRGLTLPEFVAWKRSSDVVREMCGANVALFSGSQVVPALRTANGASSEYGLASLEPARGMLHG